MNNDFQNGSRSSYRAKRKKTNIVLNSLIAIVLLLIIFVAIKIFAGGNDNATSKSDDKKTEVKHTHPSKNGERNNSTEASDSQQTQTNEDDQSTSGEETASEQPDDSAEPVITEGGSSENVKQTIENPEWKPVGTSQTGQHVADYNSNSVDWQEMLNAVSYAIGKDTGNMTVWHLGNNNHDPNKSIATVSSKDDKKAYRVYIDWVDGEGWKPSKVEELTENDQGN